MRYLLIGADFVPTESNYSWFKSGDTESLFGAELKDYVLGADYRIFNLETPLTDTLSPISKCGPNLAAPTDTIAAYKAMKVDLLTLANNHIFDQGEAGMRSTCDVLKRNNVAYLGVGENVERASQPYIIHFAGKTVGIYACCEHEFGIATESLSGANPFDPRESLDHIVDLKSKCDYVIVLYHGGKEHYRYPSPMLRKTCRKMVEKGADLVVCQHSHCIGCQDLYLGGTVVYGQGNFLFDYNTDACWNTGMLIVLDEELKISYAPLQRHENAVRLANGEAAAQIMNGFYKRSQEIKQDDFVEQLYKDFADSMSELYLFALSGGKRTLLYRAIDKLSGYRVSKWQLKRKYTSERKLVLQNFMECEAHRELFLRGIKK